YTPGPCRSDLKRPSLCSLSYFQTDILMKKLNIGHLSWVFAILCCCSCNDILTETNQNPNEVDPSVANPNMAMPTIMAPTATSYLDLNWGNLGGVIQHIQHDGWFGGVNHYEWGPENWQSYYDQIGRASCRERM